jgi:hypothetical protein
VDTSVRTKAIIIGRKDNMTMSKSSVDTVLNQASWHEDVKMRLIKQGEMNINKQEICRCWSCNPITRRLIPTFRKNILYPSSSPKLEAFFSSERLASSYGSAWHYNP